ncbi:phospholipid-transporting ATPase ABCA3-like [Haemaphysalis longicornis]
MGDGFTAEHNDGETEATGASGESVNAGWNVVTQQALGCDNVTILEVWGVMGATALAAVVLIWYLSHVLPWTSATPQSPLFPLLPWYWMPWRVQLSKDETATALNPERFEPPPDAPTVIECRGLKKYFGNFAALSGVDMTIHKDLVTVLLGHNGAGKTTLFSIITGLYTPSGGKVTVAGYDVHTDAARGMVGYCPQVDVFFDDLSVQEHIVYYAGLRGVDNPIVKANKIMRTVRLKDKAESMPHQLSGGYKRKLSVAIALVSSPKLLILDEPTSGMDPEIRESFWKIINHLRGKVTILLSTHDMEEADAIGDRIIVMHSGRVICSGSPTFLKNACGAGYKLTFGKPATGFKLDQVLAILRSTAPLAVVERERDNDVTFALHTFNCDGFEKMFRTLESHAPMLGLTGISVAVATMNDAYVLYLRRTKMLFLTGWILPVAIALLPGAVLVRREADDVGPEMLRIPLTAQAHYGPHVSTFLRNVDPTKFSISYEALLEARSISIDHLTAPGKELLEALKKDYFKYGSHYAMGAVFNDTEMEAWYNPTSVLSIPIITNLAHTALLRTYSGKPRSSISTDVALYALPHEDVDYIVSHSSRPNKYYLLEESETRLRKLMGLVRQSWLYWGCVVTISVGLILSSFVVFPAAEVHNGARNLQLMTGVPACVYLKAHFFFDLVFYFVPMAAIYGTFIYLQQLSSQTISPATFLLYILVAIATGSAIPRLPMLLFPPFLLGASTIRAVNLEFEAEMCEEMIDQEKRYGFNTKFCEEINPFGSGIIYCCKMLSIEQSKRELLLVTTPFTVDSYGIMFDLSIMIVLAVPVFCVVFFNLNSAYEGEPKPRDLHTPELDDDVAEEKELVNRLCRKKKFRDHVMLVRNLHKFFGEFYAVRGVFVALPPGECFGLVGINGAGKSTTFQMLAALLEMSDGNAYMNSLVLSKQPREWQAFIGYCPQSDALLGKLNAYETLCLFGRLRGVPDDQMDSMVERLIKLVDLEDHASEPCEHYSGGQKRKLSIAVAMVGYPPVVFLDEPYAGVDVLSRNKMRETMTALKESTMTSIVLTSHNMAECEVSCDRIGIMVKGQMTCLGSLQHLKTKFGRGVTIQFVVPRRSKVDAHALNMAVVAALPGAKQLDEKHGLRFILEQRPAWSALFQQVSALQMTFNFQHIIVTDTNLEELFLGFARKARAEAKLAIND